jgi:diketogulonate reductase-like aldo/keto reductase
LTAHGAEIPAIGFGTSSLGDCGEVVATALKVGYRHIDTAWKYGTERGVGEGIRASGVRRDEIFLTTKVSHEYLRTDDFARSVDESLENLGDCAQGADRRARQGKARGPCAPYRRRELQYRAAR